ncbi:MAG: Crp/Fnr family transcriptional regulator [Sandaracinaceae bacterium]|jgi:CRP-like cAMP-binding protein|nr:Crp/Fnr family transcriptional regulator [Sandaracinaceae bacterium]
MKPSARDAQLYARAMRHVAPLSDDEIAAGLVLVRVRELARGEHLLRAGDPARDVAVVVTGLLREHFLLADGSERTKAFVLEGELSGSLADLLSESPARAYIVAEEPCRLLVVDFAESAALAAKSPAWAQVRARATEALLRIKAEREYELLGLDAAARYAAFRARYPGLEARVAAKHVASYLGITPVHLSRLRRRRRVKPDAAG